MNTELLVGLSKDISKLMDNEEYNVIIRVGNHHEFKAHSLILRARSSYFYVALSSDWAKCQENIIRFEKPNISPDIFEIILQYMYSGIFNLEDQESSNILDLLCAVDELMIDELMEHIQTYLIQNRSTWIDENLIEILNIITPRNALSTLKNYCLEEITLLNPSTFFESKSFLNIDEIVLVSLLERDDLGTNESKLWDYVLKWGIKNTPSLSYILEDEDIIDGDNGNYNDNDNNEKKNVYKWTSKDFDELKNTLKNCIPLIRFFHISSVEFYKKVKPFSKILPQDLLEETINYHLTGNSPIHNLQLLPRTCSIQIDSKLINSRQAAIIANWLDNNNYESQHPTKSIPYTFKLLFRASVDGNKNTNLFHEKCDNVGPTIIIIKMKDNKSLVGGYNPLKISWKRSWFNPARCTNESFIFSMDHSVKDKISKLSKIVPEHKKHAIYDHPWDGPCFGSGPDLWVNIDPNNPIGHTVKKCYQPSVMNSGVFHWEDWEVFSVQRREIDGYNNYVDNDSTYSADTADTLLEGRSYQFIID